MINYQKFFVFSDFSVRNYFFLSSQTEIFEKMCVLCAYTGTENAAIELWRMGTAIEGFWSGFYTGIATIDGDGIHTAKCCGYSKFWLDKFKLSDFPGTTGLFHSRTNSGGDDAWAHPFTGSSGKVSIVSQGNDGVFSDMSIWAEAGNRAAAKGKKFPAHSYNVPLKRYPVLNDGAKVHVSEIMAQTAEVLYEANGDPLKTVRELASTLKEEGITFFIFHDQPGKVFFINMNQRGAVYFTEQGAYCASSLFAFGVPFVKYTELPLNSIGYFTAVELCCEKMPSPGFPLIDRIPNGVLRAAAEFLKEHPGSTMAEITDGGFGPLFPSEGIRLRSMTAHHIIEALYAEDLIYFKNIEVEGPCGTKGLRTLFYLKED